MVHVLGWNGFQRYVFCFGTLIQICKGPCVLCCNVMDIAKSSKGAFNIKKSMKRIVGFLEWCEDFGFNVPTGDIEMPPKYTEYKASKPSHIYLDPKAKTAVLIEKFGYTFSNIDTKRMTPREWEECIGYTGFNNRGMLREAHRKFGREPTGVHAIIDEKGLGWGFASRLKFVKFVNGIVGERFPESVDKVYIVNAPLIFSGLFAMIKPALDKDLVAKISVTSGIPTELLRSNLDPTLLPEEYGGDNTEVKVPKTVDHKSG